MTPIDNTQAELDEFGHVCGRLAGFDARLDAEWVDGYLTALAAGPLAVDRATWLPRLCDDAFARAFADPEDEIRGHHALEARLGVLRRQLDPQALLDDPDALRLSPYLLVAGPEAEPAEGAEPAATPGTAEAAEASAAEAIDETDEPVGAYWADGFLTAQDDFAADWVPSDADEDDLATFAELRSMVEALCLEPGSEALAQHVARYFPNGDPSRDDLIAEAGIAVQDLRTWWLDHTPRPAPRQAAARPGRNDPCPCGSGKKFKRCHG